MGNFANFAPKLKVKISKVGPKFSLKLQQLWKHTKRFFRKPTLNKKLQKEIFTNKTAKKSKIDNSPCLFLSHKKFCKKDLRKTGF